MSKEGREIIKKINNLQKTIAKKGMVKVGILASTNSRTDSSLGNAEIGAIHEFGSYSDNVPKRSFLWDSLANHIEVLEKIIAASVGKYGLKKDGKDDILNNMGKGAKLLIDKGFATGGYGKWPSLAPITIKRKGHEQILIDTSQLRNSITWEIE